MDTPEQYIQTLRPIQILLLLPEAPTNIFEVRELSKVRSRFAGMRLRDVIGDSRLIDYRRLLMRHLKFLESPEYLLNAKPEKVDTMTARQKYLLVDHLFHFTSRECNTKAFNEQLTLALTCLPGELDEIIKTILREKNFKTNDFCQPCTTSDDQPRYKRTFLTADDLCRLFCEHCWISNDLLEAKALCVGIGIDFNVHWETVQEYHTFAQLMIAKFGVETVKPCPHRVKKVLDDAVPKVVNACVVCFANEITTVQIPCGHASLCRTCQDMKNDDTCVVCRKSGHWMKLFI